ncbi:MULTISPECIES: MarR family transcriptional regulator [Modicisalibacter]|uniref:MarR family winged helix-turn-helix transcriptional regulator n=1 Tax=Modicisalibacter TaxID=574347 RepID=UPI0019392BFD|nr:MULTISPECIES: MarR family transcriptional regulator [Halomonadaceae]MBZ9559298.1 MarR family transcriptional regulator [Modicisalibacter sp. R2A 31.J]MBZ9576537.1 MarR family transcriptional regulator [Modicisalibacter sp. MOD 31.J]
MVGYRLTRSELLVRRQTQACLNAFELKPVEFSILLLADANPGITQRQLAELLDVYPPNLTPVTARLASRELLQQVRGRRDRRRQHLHLTPSGHALIAQAEQAVQRLEARLMERLGDEGQTLLDVLQRLEDRLSPGS